MHESTLCISWPKSVPLEADFCGLYHPDSFVPHLQVCLANRKHQQEIRGQERIFIILDPSPARPPWQCQHSSIEGFSSYEWLSPSGSVKCPDSSNRFTSILHMVKASHLATLRAPGCYSIPCWFPLIPPTIYK